MMWRADYRGSRRRCAATFGHAPRDLPPYAYGLVKRLARELPKCDFADNAVPSPDEQTRGQLLPALASNAIRPVLERRFGVVLGFQNCRRLGCVPSGDGGWGAVSSLCVDRGTGLNQRPEFVDY
jgi:hypothetical protein